MKTADNFFSNRLSYIVIWDIINPDYFGLNSRGSNDLVGAGGGGGEKKHEIYATAFGGHLFYDLLLEGHEWHGSATVENYLQFKTYLIFSEEPVCSRGGGGVGRPPSGGRYPFIGRAPVLTSNCGHCGGQYASYWNAFLFKNIFNKKTTASPYMPNRMIFSFFINFGPEICPIFPFTVFFRSPANFVTKNAKSHS